MNILPPQSIDAERAVIVSAILNKHACFLMLEMLESDDFYFHPNACMYEAIETLIKEDKPVDSVSIKHHLKSINEFKKIGGDSGLAEYYNNTAAPSNAGYYIDIVKEKAIRRRLISQNVDMNKALYDDSVSLDDIIAEKHLQLLDANFKEDDIFVDIGDIIDEIDYTDGEGLYIKTGFSGLDKRIIGLFKGDLNILAGRPGTGKTSLALNIARNIAEFSNVLIYSAEMMRWQLVIRLLSNYSKLAFYPILLKKLTDEEKERLEMNKTQAKKLNMTICDVSINIDRLCMSARRKFKQKKYDLIIVDYLQLVRSSVKGSRNEQVGDMSMKLKGLAKELEVPVLCLSQLKRIYDVETRPTQTDLRESGQIEQDADVIIFLHSPPDNVIDGIREVEVLIDKARNFKTGDFMMLFHEKYTLFEDKI